MWKKLEDDDLRNGLSADESDTDADEMSGWEWVGVILLFAVIGLAERIFGGGAAGGMRDEV